MKITDFKDVYFTCTGNTCRSPMAERIFQEYLHANGVCSTKGASRKSYVELKGNDETYVSDDGVVRIKKPEISAGTRAIIHAKYKDDSFSDNHLPQSFTPEELDDASLVLTMTRDHKKQLKRNIQAYTIDAHVKVLTLGEAIGEENAYISDPLVAAKVKEGDKKAPVNMVPYEETFVQLNDLIGKLFINDSVNLKTISTGFYEDLTRDHDIYQFKKQREEEREKLGLHPLPNHVAYYVPLTLDGNMTKRVVSELQKRKMPLTCLTNKKSRLLDTITDFLNDRDKLVNDADDIRFELNRLAKTFPESETQMQERIKSISESINDLAGKIDEGAYDSSQKFDTDYREIGNHLRPYLEGIIHIVRSTVEIPERDKAFSASMAGNYAWDIIKKVYNPYEVNRFYNILLGLPIPTIESVKNDQIKAPYQDMNENWTSRCVNALASISKLPKHSESSKSSKPKLQKLQKTTYW